MVPGKSSKPSAELSLAAPGKRAILALVLFLTLIGSSVQISAVAPNPDDVIQETMDYIDCLVNSEEPDCEGITSNQCVLNFGKEIARIVAALDVAAVKPAANEFTGCLQIGPDCVDFFVREFVAATPNVNGMIAATLDFLECMFGIDHVPNVQGTFSVNAKDVNNGQSCFGTLKEVYESQSQSNSDSGGGGVEILFVSVGGQGSHSWSRSSTEVKGILWDYQCHLTWDSTLYASGGNYRRAETYWTPGEVVARACEYEGQPVGPSYCVGQDTGAEPGDIVASEFGYDHWEIDTNDWVSNIPETGEICINGAYNFYAASHPSLGVGYQTVVEDAVMLGDFASGCRSFPIAWEWDSSKTTGCVLQILNSPFSGDCLGI